MRKLYVGCVLAAASLLASQARAVKFYMPVPYLGANYLFETEFLRQDTTKEDVAFTFVGENKSGLGLPAAGFKVLPGPSTNVFHPLLTDNYSRDFHRPPARCDPKYYVPGSGMVTLEGEQGLLAIATAVEIGGDPATAWSLPLLTDDDAFTPGDTAYVLGLMKDATTNSQLSIFNLHGAPATCSVQLLSSTGTVLDTRSNLTVQPIGALRIADILSKVTAATASELTAAVTCDSPFYALGGFPSPSLDQVRVHYPSPAPATTGTAVTFVNDAAGFKANFKNSVQIYNLPLEAGVTYRSISIDFDTVAAWPANGAYYRGLLGMWRLQPGQRFGKTLYFGINERFDRSKLLVDLGSPYIEIMIKKSKAPIQGAKLYHFHIDANADRNSFHMRVTNGANVVADMQSGLFNSDFVTKNGNSLTVGFGLPGIGDGAYSPPYGWKFFNILIKGAK
jgi:hypothetical protein